MNGASAFDTHMMQIALAMARRGLGSTAPNPSVGAVIADEKTGEVIARGWTQPGGRPHAEKEALARAGGRARGRTMYVTLEPCAHTGRTPTCADAMVTADLARVVCALPDPNPVVSGRGFGQLRAAGIAVDVGLMEDEARHITLGHVLRQTINRPFVQIKMALDATGAIAIGNGAPVWVTSTEARALGHSLRAEADAIIVGSGTVIADNPSLTCRLPGLAHRSPDRIILDTNRKTSPRAHIYAAAVSASRVFLASAEPSTAHNATHLAGVATPSGTDIAKLLASLAKHGITRVLVEGGPRLWLSFLQAGLVDEAIVMIARATASGPTTPVIDGDRAAWFARFGLIAHHDHAVGPDRVYIFRREAA